MGETRTIAPLVPPACMGSIPRGEGEGVGAGGPARLKLSVTVTSPAGAEAAVLTGMIGTVGADWLLSLPSMRAA